MAEQKGASPTRRGLFTVRSIAEDCDVSERTVLRWIKDGELRVLRFNRLVRIAPDDFEEFLRRHRGAS